MNTEDVTKTLKPTEVLAVYILRAQGDAYCKWVPKWAWEMYKGKISPILYALKEFGITDEMVKIDG